MEIRTLSPEQLLQIAVEVGEVPRYLYKYCTVDSALEFLGNHSVWFATFDQFNDPFDCAMQISEQYTKDDWENLLTSQGVDTETKNKIINDVMANPSEGARIIRESIEGIKKQIGILCLSDRYDNLSLWAYYANQHRGVCLEFDMLADLETFSMPKKVSYDNTFPMINYLHDQGSVVDALFHKSKDWQVEGEYRIIKHKRTGLREIKPEALTKVILGLRCDNAAKENIVKLLDPKIYAQTQLFRAIKSEHEYKIGIEVATI